MKSVKIAAASLIGVLLLSACEGSGAESDAETKSPAGAQEFSSTGTDPIIVVHDLSVAPGMTLKGRLGYLQDGKCLVVQGKHADEEYTASPIWPTGVEPVLSDGKRGVRVPGFGTISEGDTIVAAGSFWQADDKRIKDINIDASCLAADGFIVFNADSFES